MPIDLTTLNNPQREAVECTEGPLLVLAGAGSGKTRVLTHRIAHIIEQGKAAPWEIMAITFTNKAAAEMRERLGGLIGQSARGMWVSTFHSMCVRILRADCDRLGFHKGFTIYDDDDSNRLVKQIMQELNIDPKRYPIPAIRNRISHEKNNLVTAEVFDNQASDFMGKMVAPVYLRLQKRMKEMNAFDFDDLLLYTYLLFKYHPDVLEAYQNRFRYILVDEYQDTNHAQYQLTKMLAAKYRNIMVVGDDDQSIYSWRGADLRNILDFEKDYAEAHVIKLEENYRSTGNILAAANAVIANNATRKQKKLFTSAEDGEKISIYTATDERDEGRWIAGEIEKRHAAGHPYNEIAVFYRTNAQSRMLEDMFLRAGVPYRLVGGTRFFDRQEIRDVMAYLNLVVNPANDVAAHRIINVPRRGIGKATIEHIDMLARECSCTFLQAAELCIADEEIRPQTRRAIGEFTGLIREAQTYSGDLRKVVETIIDKAGIIQVYQNAGTDEAEGRIENIKEFFGVVEEYAQSHEDAEALFEAPTAQTEQSFEEDEPPVRSFQANSLADFTEWVTLRTDMDSMAEDGAAVTLMTIHSSKGLEYDVVFVAGMEESLFPHGNSSMDPQGLEEERRLAYVAITRARKRLYLTCAFTRRIFGQTTANPVSRFISEIPPTLRSTIGTGSAGFSGSGWEKRGSRRGIAGSGSEAGGGRVFGASSSSGSSSFKERSAVSHKKQAAKMTFAVGDEVDHKVFGRGTVKKVEGDTLHIRFKKTGQTKKLLKDYAPIVKIG